MRSPPRGVRVTSKNSDSSDGCSRDQVRYRRGRASDQQAIELGLERPRGCTTACLRVHLAARPRRPRPAASARGRVVAAQLHARQVAGTQRLDRALEAQPPGVQHADMAGDQFDFAELVAGDEHGDAVAAGQSAQQLRACPGCRPGRGRCRARRGSAGAARRAAPARSPGVAACRASTRGRGARRRRSWPIVASTSSMRGARHAEQAPGDLEVLAAASGAGTATGDSTSAPTCASALPSRRGRAASPNRRMVPRCGRSRPSSRRMVVVLPAPLGPRKP